MSRWMPGVFALVMIVWAGACGDRLGFRNRVLWRVPSPDGRVVAVCQEIPVFDGPDYDVRLERPDGTLVSRLYRGGDADGCSEIAWAPDSRTLAVLVADVARVRFVDVARVLQSDEKQIPPGSWPSREFSTEHTLRFGRHLQFVNSDAVEFTTCSYSLAHTQETHGREHLCTSPEIRQRLAVPRS